MTTKPTAEENCACACQRIRYAPINNRDGTFTESWACTDCGSLFMKRFWFDRQSSELEAARAEVERLRTTVRRVATDAAFATRWLAADDKLAAAQETKVEANAMSTTSADQQPVDSLGREPVPEQPAKAPEAPRDIYMVNVNRASGSVFVKVLDYFRSQGGFKEDWGTHWVPLVATSIEDAREKGCALPGARPYDQQAKP